MNTETKKRKDLFRLVSSLSEALEDVKTDRAYSFEDAERELFPES